MNQADSIEEVIQRLDGLQDDDKERAHEEADFLLLDALLLCKQFDVVDAFLAARKRVGVHYA